MSNDKPVSDGYSVGVSRAMIVVGVLMLAITLGIIVFRDIVAELKTEALYTEALKDRDHGDLVSAKRKLTDIVRTNPSFKDAKDKLAEVKQRINPGMGTPPTTEHYRVSRENAVRLNANSTDDGQGSANQPGDADLQAQHKSSRSKPGEPAETILPSKLEGFKLVSEKSGKDVSSRLFESTNANSEVRAVTVAVKEHGDGQKAADALYSIRFKYRRGQQLIWVNSRMAYYGYDGNGLSILAWSEGGETVEIEVKDKGVKYGQLGALLDIAREL